MADLAKLVKDARKNKVSDAEIRTFLTNKGHSESEIVSALKTQTGLEKNLPAIGATLGGFLGPLGSGLGYIAGKGTQETTNQLRGGGNDLLANIIGDIRSKGMTNYGKQRTKELGLTGIETPEYIRQLSETGQQSSTVPQRTTGSAVKDVLTNKENLKEARKFETKTMAGGVREGLFDLALEKLFTGLANAAYGKTGKQTVGTPRAMKEGIDRSANETGKQIDNLYEEIAGRDLDPTELVRKLEDLKTRPDVSVDPKAVKKIDDVINSVTKEGITDTTRIVDKLPVEQARGVKGKIQREVYGEAGKELSKRGSGVVEKQAKQIAGDELQKLIEQRMVEEGFTEAPETFAKYGSLRNISRGLEKPFQNYYYGGIGGMLLSSILGPQVAIPAAAGISAATMPYTRALIPQLVGRALRAGEYPALYALTSLYENGQ